MYQSYKVFEGIVIDRYILSKTFKVIESASYIICLPTEHPARSSQELVQKCPCVQRSNWNLEMLLSEETGKPENPVKNLSEQSREPTTNSTVVHRC